MPIDLATSLALVGTSSAVAEGAPPESSGSRNGDSGARAGTEKPRPSGTCEACSKLALPLRDLGDQGTIRVIVQFKHVPSQSLLDKLVSKGCRLKRRLSLIKAAVLEAPAALLEEVAAEPEVVHISPDGAVNSTLHVAQPTLGVGRVWRYGEISTESTELAGHAPGQLSVTLNTTIALGQAVWLPQGTSRLCLVTTGCERECPDGNDSRG